MTTASLVEVGRRQLRPGGMVAVVVADASLVAEDLRRLGWTSLEILGEEDLLS